MHDVHLFPIQRAGRSELELFSMLCSREIFTDQRYHACIRSEKNPSIRSDACMTADYARGQPASAWPLAGQPCKFDCKLHTIARAHNRAIFVRPIGTIGPDVAGVECIIMCTPIMHSSTPSKLMPKCLFQACAETGVFGSRDCNLCLLYTSPSPRDGLLSRMPSSA